MADKISTVLCSYPMGPGDTNSCCADEMGQKRCQRQARAVLEAMAEPTFGMWMAGLKRHGECRVESAKGLYKVMIQAALNGDRYHG